MSDLDELIKINKNIEEQNREIIRLLKKIAGEEEDIEIEEVIEKKDQCLNSPLDVGEVFFIDDDIFKLSVKNNELTINNLTGSSECTNFNECEIIANESIKNNQSLDDSTVILTNSSKGKLPETLNLCIDEGAKKVYIPQNQMAELLSAPPLLYSIIKVNLYKDIDDLIERLFNN